jgi:hypothetical protein
MGYLCNERLLMRNIFIFWNRLFRENLLQLCLYLGNDCEALQCKFKDVCCIMLKVDLVLVVIYMF